MYIKIIYIRNLLLLCLSGMFVGLGLIILFYVFTPLPDVEVQNIASKQSTILEDRNGEFLFDFSENEKRVYTPIEKISPNVINAVISIEDHLFFEHKGVRIDSFLRALVYNILTLSFSQGGSTITQQLIKNVYLTTEKKIERKMKEFLLAWKIEKVLEKEKILELYLNTIPYGGVIYGISEASNFFFGKKPDDITIAEASYLAAIPNAPTYFSPYGRNKKDLEKRKNAVLTRMLEYSLITREEYNSARKENVYFKDRRPSSIRAPHFVFFVKEQIEKEYGTHLRSLKGERIRTSVDLKLQKSIEESVEMFAEGFEEKYRGTNIASVVIAAKTGEILAMVGSRDFFNDKIDGSVNIITSLRQPGSTFKPIAYAKVFEKGLRPETILYDVPTQFTSRCEEDKFESTEDGCYSPVNYTGTFKGPISLRSALAQSINVPAVKVLYIAGVKNTIELAEKMGITSLTRGSGHYGLSLVLGGAEVTPLELAQAYSVFANEGRLIPYTWKPEEKRGTGREIISKKVAQNITSILSDDRSRSPVFGERSPLYITSPQVAVKTGTTNNSRDIWVVGYSPDLVVLVWGGNSDGTLLENNASGFSLSRLFREIMLKASAQYGDRRSYFSVNTTPSIGGHEIISGIVDLEDQHTILHYIQKERIHRKPQTPEEDPQYKNWEFGVQDWLEQNTDNEHTTTDTHRNEIFSIQSPEKNTKIPRDGVVIITATPIGKGNTQYEFYVNKKLIGSSYIPLISFTPSQIVKENSKNITIQIIASGSLGVFSAEETFSFK